MVQVANTTLRLFYPEKWTRFPFDRRLREPRAGLDEYRDEKICDLKLLSWLK
jgi:hypothetical protein